MLEWGLSVDHTTLYRWFQHYAPQLDKRCRPYLKTTNDSYRVDETYISRLEVNGSISIEQSMRKVTQLTSYCALNVMPSRQAIFP
jgi:transposase-like protein